MGRSALAIRAVRQSLGGLPLVSVRHSGWPGMFCGRTPEDRLVRSAQFDSWSALAQSSLSFRPQSFRAEQRSRRSNRSDQDRSQHEGWRDPNSEHQSALCWSGRYDNTQHAPMSAGLVRTPELVFRGGACEGLSGKDHPTALQVSCRVTCRRLVRPQGLWFCPELRIAVTSTRVLLCCLPSRARPAADETGSRPAKADTPEVHPS